MPTKRDIELWPLPVELIRRLIHESGPIEFRGSEVAASLADFFRSPDVSAAFRESLGDATGTDPWRWGFLVHSLAANCFLGTAGFKGPPAGQGQVEIAYAIVPEYQGLGHATSAVERLLEFARKDGRVERVIAHTLPKLGPSHRVLQKMGFTESGRFEDEDDGEVLRWERLLVPPGD